ncbi:MAG: hypothetical protein IT425_02655 [Pirellulales bacterium]|nr:hypothetical protein [Pirellulales bacterium]
MTTAIDTRSSESRPVPVAWEEHQADLERRRKERDAKREELLKCCNATYAASREMEKPLYEFSVSARWMGAGDGGISFVEAGPIKVIAQSEHSAWASFCDSIREYPSRRVANATISKGKQLSERAALAFRSVSAGKGMDPVIPTRKAGPKRKRSGL